MSARETSPARVYLHTLGCPKNEADSRALRRSLAAAGAIIVDNPRQASHIVVNTCGFIQDAKEESIGAILDACSTFPEKSVLVVGCLVERYRRELESGIPEVADWFGLLGGDEQERLVHLLAGTAPQPEEVRTSSSYAYLKISDGCDEPCTFCAIPGIKGPYHSYTAAEIQHEAEACLAEGVRELVLVGQDTSLWNDQGVDLAGLIELLARDERVRRIRVMYLQPEHVPDSFLEFMSRQPKLCRYLDVPFQHSHPEILRRMGRSGDADSYRALLDRVRRLMPDAAVRSAFIVGFPGEQEEHLDHLLTFVEDGEFDYAGGFVYSPEEGTVAAGLKPRVKKMVARRRLNRLNAVLLSSAERKHQALVGSRMEVMIDSLDREECGEGAVAVGRTEGQAPEVDGVTYIEGGLPEGIAVGDIVPVTITAAVGYDLIGTCDATS